MQIQPVSVPAYRDGRIRTLPPFAMLYTSLEKQLVLLRGEELAEVVELASPLPQLVAAESMFWILALVQAHGIVKQRVQSDDGNIRAGLHAGQQLRVLPHPEPVV